MINKIKEQIPIEYHGKISIIATLIMLIILFGIITRVWSNSKLANNTKKQAVMLVTTVAAKATDATEDLILPGTVTAWHEAIIYARTNGYVKKWLADIGSKVKKDDVLALIEIPEIEAQLRQAEADLKTAVANNDLAQSTSQRWVALLTTNSVSKQETDEKMSSAHALQAAMNSARAKRDMLVDLVNFKRVVAPFDGIITNRSTDIGALISEGSSTSTTPLFTIAQADRLRVYVKVPQNYSSRINKSIIATLKFSEHPGKSYKAKLIRTAKAIDPTTRTLLTELEVDNSNYELLPGGFTEVHLGMPGLKESVTLPVNTLIFRASGLQVATIDNDNKVVLKPIKIARDFGTEVEIDSGIAVGDQIIINPSDSLTQGAVVEKVTPKIDNQDKAKL